MYINLASTIMLHSLIWHGTLGQMKQNNDHSWIKLENRSALSMVIKHWKASISLHRLARCILLQTPDFVVHFIEETLQMALVDMRPKLTEHATINQDIADLQSIIGVSTAAKSKLESEQAARELTGLAQQLSCLDVSEKEVLLSQSI